MTMWFYMKLGGHWPDDGAGGGYGHVGFTGLGAEFDPALALNPATVNQRYQPRAGGPRTTETVPTNIQPAVDLIWYVLTEPSTWSNGVGSSAYRIYVRNPAGVEVCVYSAGQPQERYEIEGYPGSFAWRDDTDSPYYLASGLGVIPAGWGTPSAAQSPSYFTPDGGTTWLYASTYNINKTSSWDVGQWRIRVWVFACSDAMNPDPGPWSVSEEVTWSFTVGSYETYELFGTPASTPPVVSNVSPATGTELTPTESVSLDVTDNGNFRRILLKASFDGIPGWELVYDGDAFDPRYSTSSSVSTITGGMRFSLMRTGGWPAAPTITPFAIDDEGSENA